MGAYENPTQAIDRESGMIIADAISRIGQQTANYIQQTTNARNKEAEKARKEEDIRLANLEKNRDTIHANIQKSGGRSQSWFDLADNSINEKYRLEGLLSEAPDQDQENEDGTITYSRKSLHAQINKEKSKIRALTNGLTDIKAWSSTQGQKLLNSKTNEPGGIYTGSCSEGSSKFNKSICQDYERKMALMGTLTRDGKVVTDVTYELREIEGIPSVWAKVEGKDAFNVSDVLTQDFAEAENIFKGDDNDGTNAIFAETGLRNKNGKWIDSMLGELEHVPSIMDGKKVGMKWIRKVKTNDVIGRLIPEYETHFLAMVNSVENKQDYNDLMATYLTNSKEGGELKTVADGVYKLTPEAKAKFVQEMVGVALQDKIPGYEIISAQENGDDTVTYINQDGQEVTTGDYKTEYSYVGKQTGKGYEDVQVGQKLVDPTATTDNSSKNTWAVDNYNSFQENPIGYLQGENMRGFKKSEDNKNIITFDVTDDDGKVTGTDTFNIQEPNDIKSLFLNIDNTQAGRKRAEQVYNIAKQEKAARLKKEKEAETNKKSLTEEQKLQRQKEQNKEKLNNSAELLFNLAESQRPKPKPEKVKRINKKNANKDLIKELNDLKGYNNHYKTQQFLREYNSDWSDKNIKEFIQKLEKKTEAKKTPKDKQIETLDKIREKYKLGPKETPTKEQINEFLGEQQSKWDNLKVN